MNDQAGEKKVVLVVDDEPMNITLLAGILKSTYKVKMAKDGERALKLAQADPPDLILLDVMMPGLDGYEVCRRLKSMESTRGVPVIFVTGMTDPQERARALDLGAEDCLCKPVDAGQVLDAVRKMIG